MIRVRRAIQNERGATAVEYGLIAGLIALGVIGSLISTRGSLNAVFGTVSSKMGSPDGAAVPSLTASQAYWANKGVAAVTSSSSYDQITFNDGSYMQVSHPGSPYDTLLFTVDNAKLTSGYVGNDAAGNLIASYNYQYYDTYMQKIKQIDYASYQDSSITNGVINQINEVTYSTSGSQTGTSTLGSTSPYAVMGQSNLSLISYAQGVIAKK